jgi:hypothetical protein
VATLEVEGGEGLLSVEQPYSHATTNVAGPDMGSGYAGVGEDTVEAAVSSGRAQTSTPTVRDAFGMKSEDDDVRMYTALYENVTGHKRSETENTAHLIEEMEHCESSPVPTEVLDKDEAEVARMRKGKGADPGNWGTDDLSSIDFEAQAAAWENYRQIQHERDMNALNLETHAKYLEKKLAAERAERQRVLETQRRLLGGQLQAAETELLFLREKNAKMAREAEALRDQSSAASKTTSASSWNPSTAKVSFAAPITNASRVISYEALDQLPAGAYMRSMFKPPPPGTPFSRDSVSSVSSGGGHRMVATDSSAEAPPSMTKPTIKPVPPPMIGKGRPDLRKFMHWGMIARAYLEQGQVPDRMKVSYLLPFLETFLALLPLTACSNPGLPASPAKSRGSRNFAHAANRLIIFKRLV